MHQYLETDGKEDRKPGEKTRVKEIRKVWVKGEGCAGTKLYIDIHNPSSVWG